jgi:hypothetical protein
MDIHVTTRSWFGPYVRPQARISVDAIHDLMHRELADCGVRLDFPVLPQHPFVIPETSYRELFRAGHGLLRLLRPGRPPGSCAGCCGCATSYAGTPHPAEHRPGR